MSSPSRKATSSTVQRDTRFDVDIEQKPVDHAHMNNTTVHNFAWQKVTVTAKDRKTKQSKAILDGVDGFVEAGVFRYSVC